MAIECEFLTSDHVCTIASDLCGARLHVNEDACTACLKCTVPKAKNFVTASLAMGHIRKGKNPQAMWDPELKALLYVGRVIEEQYKAPVVNSTCGDVLHEMLSEIGFEYDEKCPCKDWILKMNLYGPDWVLTVVDKIAASMINEAKRRKIVSIFSKVGFLLLIAKKVPLAPHIAAARLVEEAVHRCRSNS